MLRQFVIAHLHIVVVPDELAHLGPIVIFALRFLDSVDLVMWTTLGCAVGLGLDLSCSLKQPFGLFFLRVILAASLSDDSEVAPELYHLPHGFIVNSLEDGVAKCQSHV